MACLLFRPSMGFDLRGTMGFLDVLRDLARSFESWLDLTLLYGSPFLLIGLFVITGLVPFFWTGVCSFTFFHFSQ